MSGRDALMKQLSHGEATENASYHRPLHPGHLAIFVKYSLIGIEHGITVLRGC